MFLFQCLIINKFLNIVCFGIFDIVFYCLKKIIFSFIVFSVWGHCMGKTDLFKKHLPYIRRLICVDRCHCLIRVYFALFLVCGASVWARLLSINSIYLISVG